MTREPLDSFKTRSLLTGELYYYSLPALEKQTGRSFALIPYSIRVLLEDLLRLEDGRLVTRSYVDALARWSPEPPPDREIPFIPSRVLLQDFTGVPVVVDLAAMREAATTLGADPERINRLFPVDLVIDHSVQVDASGSRDAFQQNATLEYARNGERYAFLKWGQKALKNFRAGPQDMGNVHQVNLEYLAPLVAVNRDGPVPVPHLDLVYDTHFHTPITK